MTIIIPRDADGHPMFPPLDFEDVDLTAGDVISHIELYLETLWGESTTIVKGMN
jgi:hypothetical protein